MRRLLAAASTVVVLVAAAGSVPVNAGVASPPAPSSIPSALTGDFNGDGLADIVLTGASGWTGLSVALRNTSGGFTVSHTPSPAFAAFASLPGVKIVTGKFDDDQRDDIVLTGVAGWTGIHVARSNGDGTFAVSKAAAGSFPGWAGRPEVSVFSGDFNGDGRTDLALTGGENWTSIPLALSNGDGTFLVTNAIAPNFAARAQADDVRILTEDFDGDGRTDLLSVPGGEELLGNLSLNVAFSNGDGSFRETTLWMPDFVGATDGKSVVAGHFNYDGRADLAVVLPNMVLVAYSMGETFDVYRAGASESFFFRATRPGARVIGTDNDCDRRTDLVVLSEPDSAWGTMPVAMPRGEEEFVVLDDPVPNFPQWATIPSATTLAADFDADGCEDLALTGVAGWNSIPIALSNGDGSYSSRDVTSPTFAGWAAGASPVTLPTPPSTILGALSHHDTLVWSGGTPSVTVGPDGLGIVSYYVSNSSLQNLRVARCADAACTSVTTNDVDTVGDLGQFSSIKIGADGLPLISYVAYRDTNFNFVDDLKVAHCNDMACTSATVTTLDAAARVTGMTSLTIGGDGLGLITYRDSTINGTTKVKVAHCLNVACTAATLSIVDTVFPDNGENGGYSQSAIATGNHGLGLISYYSGSTAQQLKVAACTNADCSTSVITVVEAGPGANRLHGGWSSITFGHDGLALIAYNGNYTLTGSDLRIAHCLDVYCTTSTKIKADSGGFVGWRTSIAVGGDGLGVITHYDITNRDLKLTHCDNLVCSTATTTVVDGFDDEGWRSSIAIGADGRPFIGYTGQGQLGVILRVVRCGSPDCASVITAPF